MCSVYVRGVYVCACMYVSVCVFGCVVMMGGDVCSACTVLFDLVVLQYKCIR